MNYKYDIKSDFDRFYRKYEQDMDRRQFVASIYSDTRSYCTRHLSRDPDVISDFLLNFFEHKLERLVLEFQRRNHPSFPGFYLLCIRNDFANFMRGLRRRAIPTIPLYVNENDEVTEAMIYHNESRRREETAWNFTARRSTCQDLWVAIEESLAQLDGIDPILFKMYHNIPLNINELRRLVELYGIEKTQKIVSRLENRRNYRVERLEIVQRRMDRYISKRLRGEYPPGARKRESYVHCFHNRHWTQSVQGLAALLEISRQLASFRLRRATRHLRSSLLEYHQDIRSGEAG